MAKTLDEILERNDYKRLSKQLKERTENIAYRIACKMYELDVEDKEIKVETEQGKRVTVTCKEVRSDGEKYKFLAIREIDGKYYSLENVNHSFYFCGNFYVWVRGASHPAALRFLNAAKQIIEKLGEIEERKVKAVETALSETENL